MHSGRAVQFFSCKGSARWYNAGKVSIRGIYRFYREGFRAMTLGRTLWCIILVKLVVIFVVLRLFFFTPHLQGTAEEKSRAVSAELIERNH